MNTELELVEKIERYSRGRLSPQDRLSFEKEIDADPLLKRRVEASRVVEEMVIGFEALKLKEQMQKDLSPKFKWKLYAPIAILAVTLLVGSLYLYTREANSSVIKSQSLDQAPAGPLEAP